MPTWFRSCDVGQRRRRLLAGLGLRANFNLRRPAGVWPGARPAGPPRPKAGRWRRASGAAGAALLRAILNTAVNDKRIKENPCRIDGADKESSPERPVLSVAEVYQLADAISVRYRALVPPRDVRQHAVG